MHLVTLAFGSNLGESEQTILSAYERLNISLGRQVNKSSFYHTRAWGYESDNIFTNSCSQYYTDYSPLECLHICQKIEKSFGREPNNEAGYKDRTLDIDIIFYDDMVMDSLSLTIPHRLMHLRGFVLDPLKEIIPNYIHPILKKKIIDIQP